MELTNAYKYLYGRDVILADLPKKYEVTNAYIRWIISNVSSGLDNFGNVSEVTKQDKKFAQELKEKKITGIGLSYVDKLKKMREHGSSHTRISVTQSIRSPGILIGIDIAGPNDKEPKYINTKILLDKTPKRDEYMQLLRYFALGFDGSQHWALPRDSYIKLISMAGVIFDESRTLECFASPYNHQFTNYCSIYAEPGTAGEFFNITNKDNIGQLSFNVYLINPPFIEDILTSAATRALNLCEYGYTVIFIGPNWSDAAFYTMLNKSPYLHKQLVDVHEYKTLSGEKTSGFKTAHFILKTK